MNFKSQLETLLVAAQVGTLLDLRSALTICTNELQKTLDAADDEPAAEYEALVSLLLSYFNSRDPILDEYCKTILALNSKSAYGNTLRAALDQTFPMQPNEFSSKRRKIAEEQDEQIDSIEALTGKIRKGEKITRKHLDDLCYHAISANFAKASVLIAEIFDSSLLDEEDTEKAEEEDEVELIKYFYDLFYPSNANKEKTDLLMSWIVSLNRNSVNLALNIIENIVPTGNIEFDRNVLNQMVITVRNVCKPEQQALFRYLAARVFDILQQLYLIDDAYVGAYAISTPAKSNQQSSIDELKNLARTAQTTIQNLKLTFDNANAHPAVRETVVNGWTNAVTSYTATNQTSASKLIYTTTFNQQALILERETGEFSAFDLLKITREAVISTLLRASSLSNIRQLVINEMREYFNNYYSQLTEQDPNILKAFEACNSSKLELDRVYAQVTKKATWNEAELKHLLDNDDSDEDQFYDLGAAYNAFTRSRNQLDRLLDTKALYEFYLQNVRRDIWFSEPALLLHCAQNNIRLFIWELKRDNTLNLGSSTAQHVNANHPTVHLLKVGKNYSMLNPKNPAPVVQLN